MQMCGNVFSHSRMCAWEERGVWAAPGPRPLGEMNMPRQGHIHSRPAFQNIRKEGIFFPFSLKMSSCFPLSYIRKLLWFGKETVPVKAAWFLTTGPRAAVVGHPNASRGADSGSSASPGHRLSVACRITGGRRHSCSEEHADGTHSISLLTSLRPPVLFKDRVSYLWL